MISPERLKKLFRRMADAAERLRVRHGRMHAIKIQSRWCLWASRQ